MRIEESTKRYKNAGFACNRMELSGVYIGSEIGGLHICIIGEIRRVDMACRVPGREVWAYAREVSGFAKST